MPRRDKFSKKKRSEIMSKIRGKNTKLDLAMKSLLRTARIEFVMYPRIFGNPDFLVGDRLAIFCDSSFWHGRNWTRLRAQLRNGSNPKYWIGHIASNRRRDRFVNASLKKEGYVVLRFWDEKIYKRGTECVVRIKTLMEGGCATW
jgi:DNA mismatch endonuclease (patch repair protein)